MIDLDNNTKYDINTLCLESILKELTNKDIELIVVENKRMQEINNEFRQIDKPTDVLSFPIYNELNNIPLLGTIIISSDFVEEKSKKLNHSFDEEFALLFIHGLLHLLGFDHEVDNGEHRKKEEELIIKFNLPESLIVRNS